MSASAQSQGGAGVAEKTSHAIRPARIGIALLWPNVLPLAIFSIGVFALSAQRFQKRVA